MDCESFKFNWRKRFACLSIILKKLDHGMIPISFRIESPNTKYSNLFVWRPHKKGIQLLCSNSSSISERYFQVASPKYKFSSAS